MSIVIKCDSCGEIIKDGRKNYSWRHQITADSDYKLDLCSDCFKKLFGNLSKNDEEQE